MKRHFITMLQKALTHEINETAEGWVVSSSSGNQYLVSVEVGQPTCTCDFATKGGYLPAPQPSICSHTLAVINGMLAGEWADYKVTFRQGQVSDWDHLHRKMLSDGTAGVITLRKM